MPSVDTALLVPPQLTIPAPVNCLQSLSQFPGVALHVLRLDQLHPQISGNKWYKLKNNIAHCQQQQINTMVSFGGAWSNHLHALAAAGKHFKINTVALVRGYQNAPLTPTLKDAKQWGMRLIFLDRAQWQQKYHPEFLTDLLQSSGLTTDNCLIIPEGGSNKAGVNGCTTIFSDHNINPSHYDYIIMALGTGATFAGAAIAAGGCSHFLGIPVLKGGEFLNKEVRQYIKTHNSTVSNWQLFCDYHHGGYGKTSHQLKQFADQFEKETNITPDRVYTAKVFYALSDLVSKKHIPSGAKILAIHTGGLQGNRSFI